MADCFSSYPTSLSLSFTYAVPSLPEVYPCSKAYSSFTGLFVNLRYPARAALAVPVAGPSGTPTAGAKIL